MTPGPMPAAFDSSCPACRRLIRRGTTIVRGACGKWVHPDCAEAPIRPPVELSAADRLRLLDAAGAARAEGWGRWEADEPIKAVARSLEISVDPAAVESILAAVYDGS